jgi:hypothetical protein
MPETDLLPAATETQPEGAEPADIAVALPTHNNAATVGELVRAVEEGLTRGFPGHRGLLLHADLDSGDGSAAAVRAAVTDPSRLLQVLIAGDPGRPVAHSRATVLAAFFTRARRLGLRAFAVVDPELTGLRPEAIGWLLSPVLDQNLDFVAPYYVRPRFAGALTSGTVYPLVRSLFGRRLRQPGAGEFACSARFIEQSLAVPPWQSGESRIAVDLGLTIRALTGGFRLGQAWVGHRLPRTAAAPAELSSVITEVLQACFGAAERNLQWQKVRGSEPVELIGSPEAAGPDDAPIDVGRSLESFRLGQQHLGRVWDRILAPKAVLEFRRLARATDAEFRVPDDLWARTVYEFMLVYHARSLSREHLLPAFTPLYLGWLASFVSELEHADAAGIERRVEELCLRFEGEKPYLISRWRWPDRFNP